MPPRSLRVPGLVAASALALGGALIALPSASPSSSSAAPSPAATPAAALQCTPGFSATLGLKAAAEAARTLPYTVDYKAGSPAVPADQGSNPSGVGYKIDVTSPTGGTSVRYGVSPSDSGQGVPWQDPAGAFAAGHVPAWALDKTGAGTYKVTITYEHPVFGMRTAITDLDVASEQVTMNAFASETGGTAIPLTNEILANPATIPEISADKTHAGNTAYVVDGARVGTPSANTYASTVNSGTSSSVGSVFFAYDSDAPVQRLEMTYTATTGAGFWFVPPSIPQACAQPNFSVGTVHEGGIARLDSTIANQAGNGRIEGVGFTYDLPEGVVVAADPKITTGCGATVTAVPGSRQITVSGGALASGAGSCDFGVDLLFETPGKKIFDSSMISGAANLVAAGTKPATVDVEADLPALTSTLTAAVVGGGAPVLGSEVEYTAVVKNTGNAPLAKIDLPDTLGTALVCPALPLAVGASATCTSTKPHTVAQVEVDAGSLANAISVAATSGLGNTAAAPAVSTSTTITVASAVTGSIVSTLQQEGDAVAPGDTIVHALTVTNTGATTLHGLTSAGASLGCDVDTLAPGAKATCPLPPTTLTQGDIDSGAVSTALQIDALTPKGAAVSAKATGSTTLTPAAALSSSATSNVDLGGDDRVGAGDTVVATVGVTNNGNVTLSALDLQDSLGRGYTCPATLAPGESGTCTSSAYTVTQDDMEKGTLVATITGHASTPDGSTIALQQMEVSTALPATAAFEAKVTATLHAKGDAPVAGDTVSYELGLVNTGTVALTSLKLGADALPCADDMLAVGGRFSCALPDHVLTQSDIDSGALTRPVSVAGASSKGEKAAAEASASTDLLAAPGAKASVVTALDKGADGRASAGDEVTATTTVTNTGNVTLSGLQLADSFGGALDCKGDLAPGASVGCAPTVHAVTQEEMDRGSAATVVGGHALDPGKRTVAIANVTAETALDANPELRALVSVALIPADATTSTKVDDDEAHVVAPGAQLVYTTTIINGGTVAVHDVASVSGLGIGATCAAFSLLPGASTTCASSPYEITVRDIAAGQVTNVTHAEGRLDSGSGSVTGKATSAAAASIASQNVTTVTKLQAVPATPVELAFTGTEGLGTILALGGVLLGIGVGAAYSVRRRRAA